MALTIKYNHPHFPEGTVFGIPYVGQVENGGSIEVDEEVERQYLVATGRPLSGIGNNIMNISGDSSLNKEELSQFLVTNDDIYGTTDTGVVSDADGTVIVDEPLVEAPAPPAPKTPAPKTPPTPPNPSTENPPQGEVSKNA